MQNFLKEWASLSFVSMSGGPVRKFEGGMLDDIEKSVLKVERAASDFHDQYCQCDWCDDVRRQSTKEVSRG